MSDKFCRWLLLVIFLLSGFLQWYLNEPAAYQAAVNAGLVFPSQAGTSTP
jgi:hypothetical protein